MPSCVRLLFFHDYHSGLSLSSHGALAFFSKSYLTKESSARLQGEEELPTLDWLQHPLTSEGRSKSLGHVRTRLGLSCWKVSSEDRNLKALRSLVLSFLL